MSQGTGRSSTAADRLPDAAARSLDEVARADLATHGLEYGLVDTSDAVAFASWFQAVGRGFLERRLTEEVLGANLAGLATRRTTGVWDGAVPDAAVPVATVSSWVAPLTMPGGDALAAWAVSAVTVAPTHRRRGIARALMQGELRTASAAGVPVAILTASEATIYGRFGYGAASRIASVEVDRRRAQWIGPRSPGRVDFVEPAALHPRAADIDRRAAARTPGEIGRWDYLFDRVLGLNAPDSDRARGVRTVRYADAEGEAQGFVAYHLTEVDHGWGDLEVDYFSAATDDAYRALWKFLVEHDLVGSIRASLRSLDEPLPALIADSRAIRWTEVSDHLWVRILDPVRTLGTRRFSASGRLVLDVSDDLGFAAGRYLLQVDDEGRGSLETLGETDAAGAGVVRLGVAQLGSLSLGGFRPSTLAGAGAIEVDSQATLALAERMFAAERTPHLSIWF
ncbi:GNAT family N-acetyltransferase [Rathayibacter sp. YIM 133350]|uniref:GNAT family N-acetyltransferase n=1 Tax=Rathayibacter sp. YIM 133350 TaxID=3131992 RepID=UPI00307F8FFA